MSNHFDTTGMAEAEDHVKVPFFPGNQFSDPFRQDFSKSHVLDKRAGIQTIEDTKTPLGLMQTMSTGSGASQSYRRLSETADKITLMHVDDPVHADTLPDHVKFFHVVLRWYGFFTQEVYESPDETTRVRHIALLNFLEDNTWSIVEREQRNAGVPQGVLLRRCKIPELSVDVLGIGSSTEIYGRVYSIYGMDSATRNFLEAAGFSIPPDLTPPSDPYMERRSAVDGHKGLQHVTRFVPEDQLAKFLEYQRRVLRFYCVWNSRTGGVIERRHLILHYFLEDDTIEVLEEQPVNSGRDQFPKFLRRQRLPKVHDAPRALGPVAPLGEYVRADELHVGMQLSIFGRIVDVVGCDEFTAGFLRNELGRAHEETMLSPVFATGKNQLPMEPSSLSAPRVIVPPYNGFGSEEDTMANVRSITLKPPRPDMTRYNKYGRCILRFGARKVGNEDGTEPCHITLADHRYIVSFYITEQLMSVYDTTPGAGELDSGKFIDRAHVQNKRTGRYFEPADLAVGNVIEVCSNFFLLEEIEERSQKILDLIAEGKDPKHLSVDGQRDEPQRQSYILAKKARK